MWTRNNRIAAYWTTLAAMLALIGPLAQQCLADFILWDDEELTVDTHHSQGLLYGTSSVTIIPGGSVTALYAYDTSIVDISGGWVRSLWAYDRSSITFDARDTRWVPPLEFDVYLQTGAPSPDDATCAYTGIRGAFVYTIPLEGHPWVERIDYGSYSKYLVDDYGSVNMTKDDLELDVYYDANGDPWRVDIIQARGYNSTSIQNRFIIDFTFCGEVIVEDWAGRLLGGTPHYGESIELHLPDDWSSFVGDPVLGTGILSGEWFDGTPWTVTIVENASTATIRVVPEPATLALLAVGGLLLIRRRAR